MTVSLTNEHNIRVFREHAKAAFAHLLARIDAPLLGVYPSQSAMAHDLRPNNDRLA